VRPSPPIIDQQSSIINGTGFTLIELLVVIALIALLLAIFIPVMQTARERGQRAVCLSNLHQLTTAWITYADEHGGKLVFANSFTVRIQGNKRAFSWAGGAFLAESRAALFEAPDKAKGALWPYLRDIDIYRCPRGRKGDALTYAIVAGANGSGVEGTQVHGIDPDAIHASVRVGSTVVRLTRITDIVSPGAAQRAVFIDHGRLLNSCFLVDYLCPRWLSLPAIHHHRGTTLSMADGHAEYWAWKGRETVTGLPRVELENGLEVLEGGCEPQTEDGLYDLQRVQTATWGRLGYPRGKSVAEIFAGN
jgi:prepilin-type N-terminal cleavage/methylation domain-containing protein